MKMSFTKQNREKTEASACPPVALQLIIGGHKAHLKYIPQQDWINTSMLHAVHGHIHIYVLALTNTLGVYNQINISNISNVYLSCNLTVVSAICLPVICSLNPVGTQNTSWMTEHNLDLLVKRVSIEEPLHGCQSKSSTVDLGMV